MGGNRELYWKEVSKVDSERAENCNRIKDKNGTLAVGENDTRKTWKGYFEDVHDVDTGKRAKSIYVVLMVLEDNNFGGGNW